MNLLKKYLIQSIKFYFLHSPLELRYATASFSQFGEDLALSSFLRGSNGFYVDVGAYHPYNFSNSYIFYKRGWSGLNIEPNPYGYRLLKKFRKRDNTLQLGISRGAGKVRFLDDRTYSRILNDDEQTEESKKVIEIETRPLSQIMDDAIIPSNGIDFLSTDCEGHDLIVLQSNNWDKYRPKFIVTEDNKPINESEIVSFMNEISYIPICRLGMSRIFVEQGVAGNA
jgi:FkbM family methyltransferase